MKRRNKASSKHGGRPASPTALLAWGELSGKQDHAINPTTGFDCVGYTQDAPVPLDRVAQIRPGSATRSTGLTIRDVAVIDVIDADQARVTIRMFNGNAHPHGP